MKFNIQKSTPRPLDKLVTGPADDARWREVPDDVQSIDRLRQHELRQAARPRLKRFEMDKPWYMKVRRAGKS